jgi:hypothetical protein
LTRRMSSRTVALSAAFLALAAGGTAACDGPADDDFSDSTYTSDSGGYDSGSSGSGSSGSGSSGSGSSGSGSSGSGSSGSGSSDIADVEDPEPGEESDDEVFYCADEDGEIVDEENCDDDDDDDDTSAYFLWHSSGYSRGLAPGTVLDGGDYFPAGDRASRRAFKLPATGKVGNGTVKTNVVGRSSGGSGVGSGTSGG